MLLLENRYGDFLKGFAWAEAADRGIPDEGGSKSVPVYPGNSPHIQQTPRLQGPGAQGHASPRPTGAGRWLEPGLPIILMCALHTSFWHNRPCVDPSQSPNYSVVFFSGKTIKKTSILVFEVLCSDTPYLLGEGCVQFLGKALTLLVLG